MRSLFALCLVALAPAAALASAPAGVWSVPESVTVSDAASDTPSVVITGVFTVHTGSGSEGGQWGYAGFEPAQEGYLHYVCRAGEKDMCLLQWQDISKAAQDKACVGWGENTVENGQLHATGTPLGTPDPWNLGVGVVSGFTPCEYLATFDPPAGDVASDAGADAVDAGPAPDVAVSDALDAADAPSVDAGPGGDTVPDTSVVDGVADTANDDVAVASEPSTPAKAAGGSGCAGGPSGLAGLIGLGFVARRRAGVLRA